MGYFKQSTLELGTVREQQVLNLHYQGEKYTPKIIRVIPSCGCTAASYNNQTHTVDVRYNTGTIPYHVGNSMRTRKTIMVIFDNGIHEELSFIANIQK